MNDPISAMVTTSAFVIPFSISDINLSLMMKVELLTILTSMPVTILKAFAIRSACLWGIEVYQIKLLVVGRLLTTNSDLDMLSLPVMKK